MAIVATPEKTPVWVDKSKCTICDACVKSCPAGVLSLRKEPDSPLGATVDIVAPEACTGCDQCELACPDFAIFVADKKEFQFAKLTKVAEERQQAIIENGLTLPDNYQKVATPQEDE